MNERVNCQWNDWRWGAMALMGWMCAEGAFAASGQAVGLDLRPPSVPLVACDPYFSVWSPADRLTDAETVHWTGKPHRLHSLVRLDGKAYRLLGQEPAAVPALAQTRVEVLLTRTICVFEGDNLQLTLTFMTAALPEDLNVYSRPVTYITWEARSTDNKWHAVQVYFDASAELAVNTPDQTVDWAAPAQKGLTVLKMGSTEQPVLKRKGDDLRIDWGYLYLAAGHAGLVGSIASGPVARQQFAASGSLPSSIVGGAPVKVDGLVPTLAMLLDLGKVDARRVSQHVILAYDDVYSIQYFGQNLRPYWRRQGEEAAGLLEQAEADYAKLEKRCASFDANLLSALAKFGGPHYARLAALAYRQCTAANKLVADGNGQPLLFPKENFSNGCIGTVDVIYPMAPEFLYFSPSLTKAMLIPIMDYAASSRWKFPFAPHDLGTYPLANGQVYGGGENTEKDQMPVEETGNMLLLLAALAQAEGNANFCTPYWPVLERWADFLKAKGFDPENQLCTDDFAGHLAHNVNLSAKAICGLGAYAKLLEWKGDTGKAGAISDLAKEFAARWIKEADDGDHFRLALDKPGSWSQKYNLVWDRILGLTLFPDSVRQKEMAFYLKHQNAFGLPLDNRKDYTKLDWTLWTATLTQKRADFDAIMAPIWRFLNETPNRVPMTDWFNTQTAKQQGFQARSVVGGVFLPMLYNRAEWRKQASWDATRSANWAPFPK